MEGSDSGASVYTEAKSEYTKQLTLYLVPAFHRFFMELLQQAIAEEPLAKRQLWKFQESLSQIPEWNMDKVQRETNRMIASIQCDYMEELLTAVFIAHTKVLTAIRIGNKNKRVNIVVPKLDHFLHRALSESSRLLWSSAYLFHSELPPMEKQKNHRQIEQLLHDGVAQAIRGMLPVKNILKDYLAEPEPGHEEEADSDDEKDEKEPHEPQQTGGRQETHSVPEPVVETVPETVVETILEPVVEPTPEPISTPIPEAPVISAPELIPEIVPEPHPAPIEAPAPAPQATTSTPTTPIPTLVIDTEPAVRFTDFNQMIRENNHGTEFSYVAHSEENEDGDDEERMPFLDEEGEPLSDFEDLDAAEAEPLSDDDFEQL